MTRFLRASFLKEAEARHAKRPSPESLLDQPGEAGADAVPNTGRSSVV